MISLERLRNTGKDLTLNVDGWRRRLGALLLRGSTDVLQDLLLPEDLVDLRPPEALRTVEVEGRVDPILDDVLALLDVSRAPLFDVVDVFLRVEAATRALKTRTNKIRGEKKDD